MSLGEPESEFLHRVRAALADRGRPVPLPDDLEVARVIGPSADRIETFLERAEQAKSHGFRVAGVAAMIDKVVELVRASAAASALLPDDGLPGRDALAARLRDEGLRLGNPDDPDAAFTADVAITGVERAIAETASICLTSGGGRRRLASLAVPVHIGIILANQMVADLIDWSATAGSPRPASETLVSAPSKTADIELALVMGVHGPREEYLIVIDRPAQP